ncbi:hypothetical protein LZZ85_11715 [Terrimonas sp. NA20]|uniref:Uncharacterized protein n=1 Tax=Terrimonas ginsenosidimutans TaxID=2908004 RepID=A0ABS9KRK7_9BACT|nr:hypothetical protein [Terrimonas ginsenosidimutans]MCG2614956.1 hypothetical protein [Terrimonas ginsenosidimutans]
MRQKNHTRPFALIAGGIILLLTGLIVLSACQKNKEAASIIVKTDMQKAADLLQGKINCGKLDHVASEDNVAYLSFSEGSKAIIVQLMPGDKNVSIPSLANSCIITSHYGVVIKDPATNSVLLLPRDDRESQRRFAEIELLFNQQKLTATIGGTTLINFSS